ncbi:MAG: HD domain-containing protein [Holophagales bacterium]|jgi:HD-GYP domain-containing protein (c-di-GMP phosphodiesterase class II)|nr:HD domain-containing protein [Holophagales bacterium]
MANRPQIDSKFKQNLFQTIVNDAPIAYIFIDKSFRVVFGNDHYLQSRKIDRSHLRGSKCYAIANNGRPCHSCVVRDVFDKGEPCTILRKDILADGSHTYSEDLAVPIRDPKTGSIEYVLEIMMDRTAEMDMRERNFADFRQIINSFMRLLEEKDFATCQHSRHVSTISAKLTRYLGLGQTAVFNATLGGLLHDLGKLYIPDAVLNKMGKLDDKEYSVIKEHPEFTWMVMSGMSTFKPLSDVAIAHHERWDGKGYPKGIGGEDIPIEARVTAIADTYDAMTSDRPYRSGMSHEAAMAEIKSVAGTQLDPHLVEKFVSMVGEYGYDRKSLVEDYDDDGELLVTAMDEVKAPFADEIVLYDHQPYSGADETMESPDTQSATVDSVAFGESAEKLLASDEFINSVLNHTPAFYTLIDDAYNILYASDNFAAIQSKTRNEVLAGKCFHCDGKKEPCFMGEGGLALCQAVRAFSTGEKQKSVIERETPSGRRLYLDQYAIPTEIEGPDGTKIRCCLEIMFDRSREKNRQLAFEQDIRHLVEKLHVMVDEILPDVSANAHHILHEIRRFCDYLGNVKVGSSEHFRDHSIASPPQRFAAEKLMQT